jgi:hypothetical protein
MLFQKTVIAKPTEPAPGAEAYQPRNDEDDYNHDTPAPAAKSRKPASTKA